jgi:hypothetical protein
MATFHAKGWPKLMILRVMFEFQLGFLHISKDVTYYANNNIHFKFNVQDSNHYDTRKAMGGEL